MGIRRFKTTRKWCLSVIPALACLGLMCSCATGVNDSRRELSIKEIPSPIGDESGSSVPNLASGTDGSVVMSWVQENVDRSHTLYFSQYLGERGWSEPFEIASGANWIVNWADFPAIATTPSGMMLASWLEKTEGGTYAYEIKMRSSEDGGQNWGSPFRLHSDTSATEHGFVSLIAVSDTLFGAFWLDGREMVAEDGPMTLRHTTVDYESQLSAETMLDGKTCECCQTSAVRAGDGSLIVAYRDRDSLETRDISIIRYAKGVWSPPKTVHVDGWRIAGCPVNGPSIAAIDSLVAVAWFTVDSANEPRVNTSLSFDYGESFRDPVRVDLGNPLGRVDVTFFDDHSVVTTWLELVNDSTLIMARRVLRSGTMSRPRPVSPTSPDRESGFPRIEAVGEGVIVAWTEIGERTVVRTTLLTFKDQ